MNPRHRYNMLYTQTVVCVPHYVKETRKKRTRDRDRPIASRTLDRARGRDERQRTDDVERRGVRADAMETVVEVRARATRWRVESRETRARGWERRAR